MKTNKIKLLFYTLIYLKPIQVYYRIYYFVKNIFFRSYKYSEIDHHDLPLHWENYLKSNNIPLTNFYGLSYEDVFRVYGSSKIVFNLTVNNNDPEKKAQMKLRIFEAVCSGSLLITEYVEDLQDFFELEEEIVTFKTKEEAINKIVYYLSNDKERESIAEKGHQRFLKDHTSKIRLEKLLNSFK